MIEGKISFLLQVQCLIGLLLFVLKAGRQKIYSNELDAHARISEKKTNRVEDLQIVSVLKIVLQPGQRQNLQKRM